MVGKENKLLPLVYNSYLYNILASLKRFINVATEDLADDVLPGKCSVDVPVVPPKSNVT